MTLLSGNQTKQIGVICLMGAATMLARQLNFPWPDTTVFGILVGLGIVCLTWNSDRADKGGGN